MKTLTLTALSVIALGLTPLLAQTTWDGGGGTDTSWGTANNWDNNTLPAFNGADSLSVTTGFGGNTSLTLGGNRSIGRITFGGGATAISLSGDTLRLNSTTTTNAAGTALWNANTADNVTATINSNLLLQSGTPGTYTGFFRENNNSSGGTRFNGSITQGAGENWTLRFTRASTRGQFFLNNSTNSFAGLHNQGADVYSYVIGSFGTSAITMNGGFTGTGLTDHYTTAVSNNLTIAAASSWVSTAQTRLTGSLTQGSNTLSYGSAASTSLTRLEYSAVSGTGATSLIGGALATSSMSNLASGVLNLGSSSSGSAVLVLSGSSGNGLPTWSDFTSARTFNQSGGANTWRIDAGTAGTNTGSFGGFAARGADLVIPSTGGGITNTTFARNFVLGSSATLDGAQYADRAVILNPDIAYGEVAGANRYFQLAPNSGTSKTATTLTLTGPVHEMNGAITGGNVTIYPMGTSNTSFGIVRVTNSSNSLTGTSRWIIGGNRAAFTTMGGGNVTAAANMGDFSSLVMIFTSDAAFGGATEVQVSSQASSGQRTTGTMLFEDTNPVDSTTFTRNFNLFNSNQTNGPAAWGSYAGDVIYTGTVTHGGGGAGVTDSIIHVQSGNFTLGTASTAASIVNDRGNGTTHNKSGAGTLIITNLSISGTQTINNWNVRQGSMLVNSNLGGGSMTVSSGAILGGNGTIGGATTIQSGGTLAPGNSPGLLTFNSTLTLNSGSNTLMEIGASTTRGGTYDAIDVVGALTYGGNLTLSFASPVGSDASWNLFDFGSQTGNFTNVLLTGAYTGSMTNSGGVWTLSSGGNDWSFTQSNGVLALVVPEPSTWALLAGCLAALTIYRRRRCS